MTCIKNRGGGGRINEEMTAKRNEDGTYCVTIKPVAHHEGTQEPFDVIAKNPGANVTVEAPDKLLVECQQNYSPIGLRQLVISCSKRVECENCTPYD